MSQPGSRVRLALVAGFTAVFMLLFFQNCGAPVEEETDLESKNQQKFDAAPFAYDTTVNEISYLSCSRGSKNGHMLDNQVFYSFRVGAYTKALSSQKAGVRLSDEFLSFADNNYIHPYGSTVPQDQADPTQIKELLLNSAINKGAQLQLAIRPRNQLSTSITTVNTTPILNSDYTNLASSLSVDAIAEVLAVSRTTRINEFTGGAGLSGRTIDGALYFNQSETAAEEVRQGLQNTDFLALTYTLDPESDQGASSAYVARAPASETGKSFGRVYGRGFAINFAQGNASYIENPRRVMSGLSEVLLSDDLSKVQTGAQWKCDPKYRYKIVQLADRATYCPKQAAETLTGEAKEEYNMIARHLRGAWEINTTKKCAVPTAGNCYPGDAPKGVQYLSPEDAAFASTPVADLECGPTKPRDCVHYFSLCVRDGI